MYMPVTGYAGRAVLFNISVTLSGIQGWLRTARQTRSPQAGRLNRTECPLCAVSSTDGCNTLIGPLCFNQKGAGQKS